MDELAGVCYQVEQDGEKFYLGESLRLFQGSLSFWKDEKKASEVTATSNPSSGRFWAADWLVTYKANFHVNPTKGRSSLTNT